MQKVVLLIILISIGAFYNASALDYHEPCQPIDSDPPNPVTSCNFNIGLTCQTGICECASLENMEYDPILKACKVLYGESCAAIIPNGQEMDCVAHAYCATGEICRCDSYYSNSTDRKCLPSKSAPCETTADCNPHGLLTCNLGYCTCPHPLQDYFDLGDTNMCYTGIESPCDPNDIPGSGKVTCDIRVAECSADSLSITGFSCQCKDSWLPVSDREGCRKGYMESCNGTIPSGIDGECLSDGGLQCYQEKCYCENQPDQVWDENKKSCAGTEGIKCTIWEDGVMKLCQTGLECIPNIYNYYGICRKTSATSNPVQLTSNTSPTSSNPEQSSSTNPTTEVSSSSNTNTQTEDITSSLSPESTTKKNGTEGTATSVIVPKFWNISVFSMILVSFPYV